jgi:hypothetical protein
LSTTSHFTLVLKPVRACEIKDKDSACTAQ